MQIFNLKWQFSHIDCLIFLKINRVEAIDEMDKVCKFHKNPTKQEQEGHDGPVSLH